jgi:hypothetical protein
MTDSGVVEMETLGGFPNPPAKALVGQSPPSATRLASARRRSEQLLTPRRTGSCSARTPSLKPATDC